MILRERTRQQSRAKAPVSLMSFSSLLFMACILFLLDNSVSASPQSRLQPTASKAWGTGGSKIKKALDTSIEPKIDMNVVSELSSLSTKTGKGPPKIIIMGGPASGKGTQCHLIASKYNLVHLSTGDMLREAVKERPHDENVKIAKEYMDSGKLVPDEIIIQIVLDRINQRDCQERGWLLDGFPRTRAQAEAISQMGISADVFLFLNVPDSILIERVVGRRTDPETGKIYHMTLFPPPAEIKDRLVQRSDDTVKKMTSRLQQFHENVVAVRRYYEDILVEIDGSGTPSMVADKIQKVIEAKSRVRSM